MAGCAAPLPVGSFPSASPFAASPAAATSDPVTIDLGDVLLAVLAGLEVRLPARLTSVGAVRWRIDAADADQAVVTPDGRFTGRRVGAAVAIAEGGGRSASVRIAITAAEGPVYSLASSLPTNMAPGAWVIGDAAAWQAFRAVWADTAWPGPTPDLPDPDFARDAVLVLCLRTVEDGRLTQPWPVLVATAPRLEVVIPERRSALSPFVPSSALSSERIFLWPIPRAAAANELVMARWHGEPLPPGPPAAWVPPARIPIPRPIPSLAPRPGASAPDPAASAVEPIDVPPTLRPAAPCLGDDLTLTAGAPGARNVRVDLQAFAPYSLSVGAVPQAPTGTRTLALLPVDQQGQASFTFRMPLYDAVDAPLKLAPRAAYWLQVRPDTGWQSAWPLPICGHSEAR